MTKRQTAINVLIRGTASILGDDGAGPFTLKIRPPSVYIENLGAPLFDCTNILQKVDYLFEREVTLQPQMLIVAGHFTF